MMCILYYIPTILDNMSGYKPLTKCYTQKLKKTYPSRKSFLLSWIWISSSTTRRNADNWGIFGNEDVECVRLGNQVAARWALLALVCTIMNIFWVVPEPHRKDLWDLQSTIYLSDGI